MPSNPSIQLPDLQGLSRPLTLRTNRHCYSVTAASEAWFRQQDAILTSDELGALSSMKMGLLASVCFPTCDPPQLRLAADFLTALFCCNGRFVRAHTPQECGWTHSALEVDGELGCLTQNALFGPLVPRITAMSSEAWQTKFRAAARAFLAAQLKLLAHRADNTLPDLEAYVRLRRDLSGFPMLFLLIQLAEGLNPPPETPEELQTSAADVIAISLDILSYNTDQYAGNKCNIVSVLRAEKKLSAQGAVNAAFARIRDTFGTFLDAEAFPSMSESPTQTPERSWLWARANPSPPVRDITSPNADLTLFVRGLKDCIVGTLNWSYETAVYFGSKGDEVRQFGWVFLRTRDSMEDGETVT